MRSSIFAAIIAASLASPSASRGGTVTIYPEGCYGATTDGALRLGPDAMFAGDAVESVWAEFPADVETTLICRFDYPADAADPSECTAAGEPWDCCADEGVGVDCLAWTMYLKRGASASAAGSWFFDVCMDFHGDAVEIDCRENWRSGPLQADVFDEPPAGDITELVVPLALPEVVAPYQRTAAWLKVVRRDTESDSGVFLFRGATLCYPPSCPPSTPHPTSTPTPTPTPTP